MGNRQEIPMSIAPATYEYKKSSDSGMYEVLQSLRRDKFFCDIILKTRDDFKIFAHKAILASASPYFYAMFTNFAERTKDLVSIGELHSTALQLLVDFIYSGKIMVTENNVQALLPGANLLLLNDVYEVCCEFLQKQLHPTNCIGIKAFADLHNCTKLLTSSEFYVQQNFTEVVEGSEFLSLSSEEVVKFISCDELSVLSEEKVFESVIRWVKHDLDYRKCYLPQLMEHVRLPLTSKNYILSKVVKEPLLNNCPKCKVFIKEAFDFHLNKSDRSIFTNPKNIRTKPRQGDKVILVVGGYGYTRLAAGSTEWYNPKNNQWYFGPKMLTPRDGAGLAVLNDHFVFAMGGYSIGSPSPIQSVDVLDLFSEPPCWKPTVSMLVKRTEFGVGVINNNLYCVGGFDGTNSLNSAEKFDSSTNEWRVISSMSSTRADLGAGVLNNLLYAVGGLDYSSAEVLKSVECYHPSLNTWTPVAEMCVRRYGAGVGVLDGVLYVVGGFDGSDFLNSVEAYRPSSGVWTTVADMNFPRQNPGVVALYGLLYVIGGNYEEHLYDSVEFYDPISNTWLMLEASMNLARHFAGVVTIVKPPHFTTC